LLIGPILVSRGPAWFLYLGRLDKDPPTVRQVQEILGRDVPVAAQSGHDGREFWVLAQDPLLLNPHEDAPLLDRPAYRAARIAYPAAAAPWGLFGKTALLIGLLITNLVAVGAGTYFTVLLAAHLRAPPIASVFFAASPVVAVAMLLDLSDAMSLAALVASMYLFLRGRLGWATVAGVVAVLAKQPALLAIIAVAAVTTSVPRRVRLSYVAIPLVAIAAWTVYALVRLGTSGSSVVEFVPPFFGYARVVPEWRKYHSWIDAVVGVALLPVAGIVIVRWWQKRTEMLAAALPFALLVPFLSYAVLYAAINSLRAFGPALTFFGLDWYANRRTVTTDEALLPKSSLALLRKSGS
jgi:hypothetical protein